jgi:plasmid stabilization system protein ParE
VTRKSLKIHPDALEETRAAVDWYAQRSLRTAEAFLNEIDYAAQQISEKPERFPAFEYGTRRILFRRFPYSFIFRECAGGVEIVAVAHGHRRPGYWRSRLQASTPY